MNQLKKELVKEWIKKAKGDSEVAQNLRRGRKKQFYNAIVFHSQQSIEKYLKALLLCYKIDFPKTHDFSKLLNLIKEKDPFLLTLKKEFMRLNPFAIDFRYPGEDVTKKELNEVVKITNNIRKILQKRIKEFL